MMLPSGASTTVSEPMIIKRSLLILAPLHAVSHFHCFVHRRCLRVISCAGELDFIEILIEF